MQAATEAGDTGPEDEHHQALAGGVDADGRRGRLAAAHGVQEPAGGALADGDGGQPESGQQDAASSRKALSDAKSMPTDDAGRGTVSGRVPLPPDTQVSGTSTPSNIRAKARVASAA